MQRLHLTNLAIVALIVLAALSQAACTPLACDPNSEEYDPGDCETLIGLFLEFLTGLAYGIPPDEPPPGNPCPPRLVCLRPDCIRVEENGGFEAVVSNTGDPVMWYGDQMQLTIIPACRGVNSLDFVATTPNGPSPSASAQVYQVIDYRAQVPEALRSTMRRARVQALFIIEGLDSFDDRQFGLRLDAYAGDPAAFPRAGDPENFPLQTAAYTRLASAGETFQYTGPGDTWQTLSAELMLPQGTDFLVVLLEHVEDVQNDVNTREFLDHSVDEVEVTIDNNRPPVARPDRRAIGEDVPTALSVLANDYDAASRFDPTSLELQRLPLHGTAEILTSGSVLYTPDLNFNGLDSLSYTVANEEGVRTNEATVTIEVRPRNDAPVAADDMYQLPQGGLLIVPTPIGVLANDSDVDGDMLTAVLVTDVSSGTLNLDPSGSFIYTPGAGFPGTDTFTYHASDGTDTSNEASVTLTGGSGYDLALTKTASPTTVGPSGETTFTVTVTNNGPSTATGIEVTDQIPAFETTVTNIQTTQGTFTEASARWVVGGLAAGERATLTITALIHLNVTNTATITAGLNGDTNPNNNSDAATVTVAE